MKLLSLAVLLVLVGCREPTDLPALPSVELDNITPDDLWISFPPHYNTRLGGFTSTCAGFLDPLTDSITVTVSGPTIRQIRFRRATSLHWRVRMFPDSIQVLPLVTPPC